MIYHPYTVQLGYNTEVFNLSNIENKIYSTKWYLSAASEVPQANQAQ